MLSPESRLRSNREVEQVFRRGVMHRHRLARLHLIREGQGKQFALVASKRVGNAVQRNRARRIFAEAIASLMSSIRAGSTGVFVLRPEASAASLTDAKQCVQQLLAASGALHAD
mgnify:CR=1 FL=1